MTDTTFTPSHPEHRHGVSLEDTFDFLNTAELDGFGRPVEHLVVLADATAWLEERGLLHPSKRRPIDESPPAGAATVLGRVRSVRAALREIVEALVAEREVDPRALATVNDVLRARSVVQLVPSEDCVALAHQHVGDPLDDALAAVSEPLVSMIASDETDRLRICANDRCGWVFHDTSRTGRRRWCSMASCGNRAKAARHRARRKTADAGATVTDASGGGAAPAPTTGVPPG